MVRVSSWKSGATARSSFSHRPVQLPQPVEARVRSFSCGQRGDAVLVNRLDDLALADAVAAADGFAVRHLGDFPAGIGVARRETEGGGDAA